MLLVFLGGCAASVAEPPQRTKEVRTRCKEVFVENTQSGGGIVRRCEDDEVICYIYNGRGISCLAKGDKND